MDFDLLLSGNPWCIFLVDWINTIAYVVLHGNTIEHKYYIEGESKVFEILL